MQECIQMRSDRRRSSAETDSDTQPLYRVSQSRWPWVNRLRHLVSGSPGLCVFVLTVAVLICIVCLVFKFSRQVFSDNQHFDGVIANSSCGIIYGKIQNSVYAFKPPATIFLPRRDHSTSDTAHALLLRSPSLPPSPSHSVHYEHTASQRWKQRRNLLAGIFTITFVIFVILSLVIGALVSKRKEKLKETTTAKQRISVSVATACGTLYGRPIESAFVFKGVPYAQAPVGQLRWVPAQPLPGKECWGATTDTLNAEDFSEPCYQYDDLRGKWVGTEDCLYLNVWSPRLDPAAKLPVMVFFHGGGLMTGSGNEPGFIPSSNLVKTTNMVYVSFNYRLNVFGYLALDILSWMSEDFVSGNYGLTDQIQALKWVQQNVAAFGGDPNQVVLYGHESGATSIYALLGSSEAKGLFHRAWLASPAPRLEGSTILPLAQLQNEAYFNATSCSLLNSPKAKIDCLHGLSSQHLGSLLDWESWSNSHFRDLPIPMESSSILLTAGGHAMKEFPIAAWKKGEFNDIPLLIGSMAQEVDADPLPVAMETWDWHQYDQYVTEKLSLFHAQDMVAQTLTHYSHKVSPEFQITSLISDIRYTLPLHAVCQVVGNRSSSPVYRYVSTYYPLNPSPNPTGRRNYAFSGMDMLAYFGSSLNISDHPQSVSSYISTIQRVVTTFASTGKVPNWGTFPDSTILISSQSETSDVCAVKSLGYFYKMAEFDFWRLHGLFPDFAAMN